MSTPIRRRSRSAMTPKKPAIALLTISFLSLFFVLFILLRHRSFHPLSSSAAAISSSAPSAVSASTPTTSPRHLIFSVASSARSWPNRRPYARLWYSPNTTRAFVFLDRNDTVVVSGDSDEFPPVVVSGDTSRFKYSFPGGLPSAVRVARVVKEVVELVDSGDGGEDGEVRWFVFGDDDTVFFVENLARTLAKYDHERWFYVGAISESFDQNSRNFFGMAFGGGGFAISASLARALAGVLDDCLLRYGHLYGSDARIYSCVAELGVGLTHEPGFHQVDVRGNLFGLLTSHPLSPVLSLHHLDAVDPIFPKANRTEALGLLFRASDSDPARVLQQSVCYDSSRSVTVSIAWGYAIQVFEGNKLLVDLLSVQKTFTTWRRGFNYGTGYYMFNTRDSPRDACKRPAIYYLRGVISDSDGEVKSQYEIYESGKCKRSDIVKNLKRIRVLSKKLEPDSEEMKAMRRQCCDILPGFNDSMVINLRKCRVNELISMMNP